MLLLDHIALIVNDLDSCAASLASLGFPLGAVEEHEGENTREIYVETSPVSILLTQPRSSSGPIARHIQRRGPGFHHLAFRTRDVASILASLRGWYALPSSFRSLKRNGPVWLIRPEMGLLLEIVPVDQDIVPKGPTTFRGLRIEVPSVERCRHLLEYIGAFDEQKMTLCEGKGRIRSVALEIHGRRILLESSGALSESRD